MLYGQVSEAGSATDTDSAHAIFAASIAEHGDASDLFAVTAVYEVSIAEGGNATDSDSAVKHTHASITEAGDAADASSRTRMAIAAITEAGTAGDLETGQMLYPWQLANNGVPALTCEQILALLQDLLPTGPAFPRVPNSVQTLLLTAFADRQGKTSADQADLVVDAFPATSFFLLPQWEASLGLPDPCLTTPQTIAQRQAAVVAKLTTDGGQSIPFLEAYAASIGYPNTTFNEFTPYTVGRTSGYIFGVPWAYALQINCAALDLYYFHVGKDVGQTPIVSWDAEALVCELRRIAPAHVYLIFNYGPTFSEDPYGPWGDDGDEPPPPGPAPRWISGYGRGPYGRGPYGRPYWLR